MSVPHYNEVAPVGSQIYWYPKADMSSRNPPFVGWITQGWTKGIANISLLPNQDGAVEARDNVFHAGDPRIRNEYGQLSEGGEKRGCWEFTPFQKLLFKLQAEQEATEQAVSAPAKKTGK
jgi:hypothetical protein